MGKQQGRAVGWGQPPHLLRVGLGIHSSPIPGEGQERAWLWPGVSSAGAALPLPPLPPSCPQPCLAVLWQLLGKHGLGRGSARSNQTQPRADCSEILVRGAETGPVAHIHHSWPFISPGPQGHCSCPALASELHEVWLKKLICFPPKTDGP